MFAFAIATSLYLDFGRRMRPIRARQIDTSLVQTLKIAMEYGSSRRTADLLITGAYPSSRRRIPAAKITTNAHNPTQAGSPRRVFASGFLSILAFPTSRKLPNPRFYADSGSQRRVRRVRGRG